MICYARSARVSLCMSRVPLLLECSNVLLASGRVKVGGGRRATDRAPFVV